VAYHALIDQYAHQYILLDGETNVEKTLIAVRILDIVRREYKSRFLARKDSSWEVIDDVEAQRKASQELRNAARAKKPGCGPSM